MKKIFLLILLLFVLSSCYPAGSDVVDAKAVDYIWGYEELRSGAVRVWLRDDQIAGYCTSNPSLASQVKELLGDKVVLSFETSKLGDSEAWNNSGCNRLSTGVETSTPIFRITDVKLYRE